MKVMWQKFRSVRFYHSYASGKFVSIRFLFEYSCLTQGTACGDDHITFFELCSTSDSTKYLLRNPFIVYLYSDTAIRNIVVVQEKVATLLVSLHGAVFAIGNMQT